MSFPVDEQRRIDHHAPPAPGFLQPGPPALGENGKRRAQVAALISSDVIVPLAPCSSTWNKAASRATFSAALAATSRTLRNAPRAPSSPST
jgi:hypothetical protein